MEEPTPQTQQKRIRVQLDFDQQGFDELEALKKQLRVGSRAETVRFGLGLLQWAANQIKSGARILVEKDGELSGVMFPFLPLSQQAFAAMPVTLRGGGARQVEVNQQTLSYAEWKAAEAARKQQEEEHS